jgi:hypothetical protein
VQHQRQVVQALADGRVCVAVRGAADGERLAMHRVRRGIVALAAGEHRTAVERHGEVGMVGSKRHTPAGQHDPQQ